MAEKTDGATPMPEPDLEAPAAQEGAPGPVLRKCPRKALMGAVAACVVVALGIGAAIALVPAASDGGAPSPDAAGGSAAASSSGASSSAASPGSSAASSSAAEQVDAAAVDADSPETAQPQSPDRDAQAQGSDRGTQAAPAETSTSPAGGGSAAAPAQPAHEHTWEPIYAEVQVGEEPIYEKAPLLVCSDGFTCRTDAEMSAHKQAAGRGSNLSHYVTYENIQVGSQPIYETQVVGYRCSGCGAQK